MLSVVLPGCDQLPVPTGAQLDELVVAGTELEEMAEEEEPQPE